MTDITEQNVIDAEELFESGLSLCLMNKNEEAIIALKKALELDPRISEAYNKLGDCLYKLGRTKEALENYLKCQELNPKNQNNYYDLGRTYMALGDNAKALENFKIANNMKPQTDIHAFVGKIYFDMKQYEEALASFNNVLIENASHPMSAYYTARIYDLHGKTDKAKDFFTKVIEHFSKIIHNKSKATEGYYYIGKCHFYLGNYAEAVNFLQLAVDNDTDTIYNHYSFDMFYTDAEAFASLAEAQSKLGKTSEAKENILKAIALEPNNQELVNLKTKLGF